MPQVPQGHKRTPLHGRQRCRDPLSFLTPLSPHCTACKRDHDTARPFNFSPWASPAPRPAVAAATVGVTVAIVVVRITVVMAVTPTAAAAAALSAAPPTPAAAAPATAKPSATATPATATPKAEPATPRSLRRRPPTVPTCLPIASPSLLPLPAPMPIRPVLPPLPALTPVAALAPASPAPQFPAKAAARVPVPAPIVLLLAVAVPTPSREATPGPPPVLRRILGPVGLPVPPAVLPPPALAPHPLRALLPVVLFVAVVMLQAAVSPRWVARRACVIRGPCCPAMVAMDGSTPTGLVVLYRGTLAATARRYIFQAVICIVVRRSRLRLRDCMTTLVKHRVSKPCPDAVETGRSCPACPYTLSISVQVYR